MNPIYIKCFPVYIAAKITLRETHLPRDRREAGFTWCLYIER